MKEKRIILAVIIISLGLGVFTARVHGDIETNHVSELRPEMWDNYEIYLRKILSGFATGAFSVGGSSNTFNLSTNVAIGTVSAVPDGIGTNALVASSGPGGANNSGPLLTLGMVFDGVNRVLNRWRGEIRDYTNGTPAAVLPDGSLKTSSTIQNSSQVFVGITNRPTYVTFTSGITNGTTALATNSARAGFVISNCSTNPAYIMLGAGCSTTLFTVPLAACASTNDGSGGTYINASYRGVVSAAGTGLGLMITEEQFVP